MMQRETLPRVARLGAFAVLAISFGIVAWSYFDARRIGAWPRLHPWLQLGLLGPAISNALIPTSTRLLCVLKLVLCVSILAAGSALFFPAAVNHLLGR